MELAIRAVVSQLAARAVGYYGLHDKLQHIQVGNLTDFARVSLLGRMWEKSVTMKNPTAAPEDRPLKV